MKLFSVFAAIPELVAELNEWRPSILSGYAGMISLLAAEQEEGRLRIDPMLVASSAEGMTPAEAARVSGTFEREASQHIRRGRMPLHGPSCELGWIHVNSDWVVVEPVDAERRPVAPGELSHGSLLTNLANGARPLIRYAIDDSVLMRPDPCPCGSPFRPSRSRAAPPTCSSWGAGGLGRCCRAAPDDGDSTGLPGIDASRSCSPSPRRCACAC